MNKRIVILVLLIVFVMLLVLISCIPKTPSGIGNIGGKEFYTIRMTDEERETYFKITEKAGSVAVTNYGSSKIQAISWYNVEGGGSIAWVGRNVRYVPANFGDEHRAFSTLNNESNAMSIQEAKAYVPQLSK